MMTNNETTTTTTNKPAITKPELLQANPVYFTTYTQAKAAGLSAHNEVRKLFEHLTGTQLSTGSVYAWLLRFHRSEVKRNVNCYGAGCNVKKGRSSKCLFIDKHGEKMIRTNVGWQPEYRAMLAPELCRERDEDMVVHHIDGNHTNNTPSNLQIMTRSEHSSLHMRAVWAARKAKAAQAK